MRITDLLDRRSVSLTAAPKTKSETLEKIVPVLIYPVVGILVMGLLMTFIVEPVSYCSHATVPRGVLA